MRLFTGTMLFMLAVGLAAADEGPAGQGWLQGKAAEVKPDTCNCIKDLTAAGLGAGQWVSPRLGFEVDGLQSTLRSRHTAASADEQVVQGALLFNLTPYGATWLPYLRVGLGGARVGSPYSVGPETTTRLAFHEGIGLQGFFGRHVMASVEARAVTVETRVERTEKMVLVALGLRWGAPGRSGQPAVWRSVQDPGPALAPAAPAAPVATVLPGAPPAPVDPGPGVPPTPAEPGPGAQTVAAVTPAPAPAATAPPAPASEAAPAAVLPPRIVLDDTMVHFANNQSQLSPAGEDAVREVARTLLGHPGPYRITITGHTSSVGGRAHNQELSRARAQSVARVLAAAGIEAGRMTCVGMGPDQPIASNDTREGQAKNRRVAIDLITAPGRPK
jgi:outer membrane protein OmpA-like peptidoglycan-associated protein